MGIENIGPDDPGIRHTRFRPLDRDIHGRILNYCELFTVMQPDAERYYPESDSGRFSDALQDLKLEPGQPVGMIASKSTIQATEQDVYSRLTIISFGERSYVYARPHAGGERDKALITLEVGRDADLTPPSAETGLIAVHLGVNDHSEVTYFYSSNEPDPDPEADMGILSIYKKWQIPLKQTIDADSPSTLDNGTAEIFLRKLKSF